MGHTIFELLIVALFVYLLRRQGKRLRREDLSEKTLRIDGDHYLWKKWFVLRSDISQFQREMNTVTARLDKLEKKTAGPVASVGEIELTETP